MHRRSQQAASSSTARPGARTVRRRMRGRTASLAGLGAGAAGFLAGVPRARPASAPQRTESWWTFLPGERSILAHALLARGFAPGQPGGQLHRPRQPSRGESTVPVRPLAERSGYRRFVRGPRRRFRSGNHSAGTTVAHKFGQPTCHQDDYPPAPGPPAWLLLPGPAADARRPLAGVRHPAPGWAALRHPVPGSSTTCTRREPGPMMHVTS
jgi:hypothetical protein